MIIDAGPLLAARDADDDHQLERLRPPPTAGRPPRVPSPVRTEVRRFTESEQRSHIEAIFGGAARACHPVKRR